MSRRRWPLRVLVLVWVVAIAGVAAFLFQDRPGTFSPEALARSVAVETGGSTLLGVEPCR